MKLTNLEICLYAFLLITVIALFMRDKNTRITNLEICLAALLLIAVIALFMNDKNAKTLAQIQEGRGCRFNVPLLQVGPCPTTMKDSNGNSLQHRRGEICATQKAYFTGPDTNGKVSQTYQIVPSSNGLQITALGAGTN